LNEIEQLKSYIERKLKWCNSRKQNVMDIPDEKLSNFGFHEQGFFKGKIDAYEDLLEEINEILNLNQC
jgi:hypothetical protein